MNADLKHAAPRETARLVKIPAGSVSLDGALSVPDDASGIILLAHGGSSSRLDPRHQFLAQWLRRSGLGTLLCDLLTEQEERADAGRGCLRFNIGLLTQRLVCEAHWLGGEDEARHQRLGFFGSSTGAGAALVAAADLGKGIAAVVSGGGRPDLAGNALRRVKCPSLLIVGGLDDDVLELNQGALQLLACEKRLCIVQKASPLFAEPGALEEVAQLAAGWFLEHLGHGLSSRLPLRGNDR